MKVGIELNIDVTLIDKARIYPGKKGKYLKLTTFVEPDQEDQYGNHGFVTQSKDKNEETRMPILGNAKVFWRDEEASQSVQQNQGGMVGPENVPF